jgi:hypothetical protein
MESLIGPVTFVGNLTVRDIAEGAGSICCIVLS